MHDQYRVYITEEFFSGVAWTITHGPKDLVVLEGEAGTVEEAAEETRELIEILKAPAPRKPEQLKLF